MNKNKIEEDSLRHKLHVMISSYCSLHSCKSLTINSNNNTEESIQQKIKIKYEKTVAI
jgi:hypothetical protein